MARQQDSGEGVYIAIGLLVMIVCIAGSIVTHQGVMDIFFLGLFILLNLAVLAAIVIAVISVFVYAFKRSDGDERSFFQIFKQEYANNRVVDNYRLLFRHIGEHLDETETYHRMMDALRAIESRMSALIRYPASLLGKGPKTRRPPGADRRGGPHDGE